METEVSGTINKTERSTFVTVIAWIFIVLSGFAMLISILQNVTFHLLMPRKEMSQAFQYTEANDQMPAVFNFLFNNFGLILTVFLIITIITFISAIALLKRKNWARIVFIILMALGIGYNIVGVILQQSMLSNMTGPDGSDLSIEFERAMLAMRIFTVIMVLGMSVLFGWIMKKLMSERIKIEFT